MSSFLCSFFSTFHSCDHTLRVCLRAGRRAERASAVRPPVQRSGRKTGRVLCPIARHKRRERFTVCRALPPSLPSSLASCSGRLGLTVGYGNWVVADRNDTACCRAEMLRCAAASALLGVLRAAPVGTGAPAYQKYRRHRRRRMRLGRGLPSPRLLRGRRESEGRSAPHRSPFSYPFRRNRDTKTGQRALRCRHTVLPLPRGRVAARAGDGHSMASTQKNVVQLFRAFQNEAAKSDPVQLGGCPSVNSEVVFFCDTRPNSRREEKHERHHLQRHQAPGPEHGPLVDVLSGQRQHMA